MTGLEWFKKSKIIAIVRGLAPEHMVQLAEALYEGGIDLIEVTFHQSQPETWQNTATSIQAIASHMTGRMLVGAGTVICEKQLDMACKAGAAYVVTPNTDSHLIRTVKARGLLSFPGAFTPSEIVEAYQAGADAVKVFPAGNLGPSYIQAINSISLFNLYNFNLNAKHLFTIISEQAEIFYSLPQIPAINYLIQTKSSQRQPAKRYDILYLWPRSYETVVKC